LEFSVANLGVIDGQFTSNKPYLFKALYEWILDNNGTPYLLVDATNVDVRVPREHIKDGQIVLNATPSAIRDWYVDNSAISFNARFSGKAQNIYIPMASLLAIYAQENGLGMAFPEDAVAPTNNNNEVDEDSNTDSSDFIAEVTSEVSQQNTSGKEGVREKKKSHLKVVK
jgi:stringent starvation protein B